MRLVPTGQMRLYGGFVEGLRLSFLNSDGPLRAIAQAGPQAIAVLVLYQAGLAVDDLNRPFRTGRNAQSTAVALRFINLNDLTRCHRAQ